MKKDIKKISKTLENIEEGKKIVKSHPLFKHCIGFVDIFTRTKEEMGKDLISFVSFEYKKDKYTPKNYYFRVRIQLNSNILLSPKEWAFIIAHNYLHLAFGHFTVEKAPGYMMIDNDGKEKKVTSFDKSIWNKACDIYITKFLSDIKFGTPLRPLDDNEIPADLHDEISIYNYLINNKSDYKQIYGVANVDHLDMAGLDDLLPADGVNDYANDFSEAISKSVKEAVEIVSEKSFVEKDSKFDLKTLYGKAASWFISSYPLLGGLAASFKIINDKRIANLYEVSVAAIDVNNREIIINPVCELSYDEWKFVLAHEYLHAGLCHEERCQGRDKYLWNVACDFVINLWLCEMRVGTMPKIGVLYDESLKNKSTEEVYDDVVRNLKKSKNFETFRGDGAGDIIGRGERTGNNNFGNENVTLDEFCKNALRQGLEYHKEKGRGYLPAGLEEEIKALSMPVIPWDVELVNWFERYFSPVEKHRSYARPSRRQSTTPDIPRPRTVPKDTHSFRTFGVIVDTSGSMSAKDLGMALGSIASYSNAKDVEQVRVVFCDANAYDVGYLSPEDIAGRVVVKGRGGTILQPAVNLLEKAKDFPKKAPILIITDGYIESDLCINSEHAFLIPRGSVLPFKAKGEVFYYSDKR